MFENYTGWMILVFIIGYFFITIEHVTKINKATIALLMGVVCWVLQFSHTATPCPDNMACLGEHLSSISQVVFFLLGALTIVEIINVHKGFKIISDCVQISSKRWLLWVIGFITFFLSAVLDNLTTTIVMVTLMQKIILDNRDRLLIGGGVVIAANAGGAWTPIGDVTTTMLWVGGELSTSTIMKELFIPSMVCMIVSFIFLTPMLKGSLDVKEMHLEDEKVEPMGEFLFFLGIGVLVFVPIFKYLTGLPPFMGMLLGLGVMWLVTDVLHREYHDRKHLRVPQILPKVDLSGVIFFLGILLAINALESAHILADLAVWLDRNIGNTTLIATFIGIASAVIDNIPLVAATMGMYDLSAYPMDDRFWQLIAYCAGTGGSILIIGSAAGIVYMGLEKVDFFWYVKRISLPALIGYLAGVGIFLLI